MNTTQETLTDYQQAALDASKLFDSLNLTTQTSAPVGDVRDEWPNILYHVSFSRNGRNFATEYRLGVGHVNWKKHREPSVNIHGITADEQSMIYAMQNNPSATFKNKTLQASAAAKLAKAQKVAPKPYEVLAAICDDGQSAHNESWDNYAANFGMDADSIKGKQTYDLCCDLYHKVVALIGSDNVAKFAELHSQF